MTPPPAARITREEAVLVYDNPYLTLFDDRVRFSGGQPGRYLRLEWKMRYSVAILPIPTTATTF